MRVRARARVCVCVKCLAIEKVHTDDTEKRQERESFWIRKMRTLIPLGLNMQQ